MNWKKIILYGVLLWVFIFVVISVIMFIPTLTGKLTLQKILDLMAVVILVLIFGRLYFKKQPANFGQGILIGIVWVLATTILDLTITVPLFIQPKGESYGDFYSQWDIWVGLALVILVAGLAAVWFSKKGESPPLTSEVGPEIV